jgi:succinate dehydrogenase/fumarate reductase flavoprotein subunit
LPNHDVLVIGAGLAGQRAALAAAEQGVSGATCF